MQPHLHYCILSHNSDGNHRLAGRNIKPLLKGQFARPRETRLAVIKETILTQKGQGGLHAVNGRFDELPDCKGKSEAIKTEDPGCESARQKGK